MTNFVVSLSLSSQRCRLSCIEGDDGMSTNLGYDFDEISVMPVSCVN